MVQKALIVGINKYPGAPLQGCVNDARDVEAMLKQSFGFTNVAVLLDEQATTANIKSGLLSLIKDARPGDVLFFHYSGHGSQIRDTSGDEQEELDEIICPVDLDWNTKLITDDYMKWVFDQVPAGVNVTVLLDCCNSGSALDQDETYQPLGIGEARDLAMQAEDASRFLPPPTYLKPLMEGKRSKKRSLLTETQARNVNASAMLITGCQSQQTSADAYINGRWQGAATYSLTSSLRTANYTLDYKTLIERMNDFMVRNGYSQRPELNGSTLLYSTKFLQGTIALVETTEPVSTTPPPPPPPTTQNHVVALEDLQKKKDTWKIVLVGGVVLGIVWLVSMLA
jgi:hypothetical protein